LMHERRPDAIFITPDMSACRRRRDYLGGH
jgi:hypothetical protein